MVNNSSSVVVCDVRGRSIFRNLACTVVRHTGTKMKKGEVFCTFDSRERTFARASCVRAVVTDKPGRADISLGTCLLCETKQKYEQTTLPIYCFHIAFDQSPLSNTHSMLADRGSIFNYSLSFIRF